MYQIVNKRIVIVNHTNFTFHLKYGLDNKVKQTFCAKVVVGYRKKQSNIFLECSFRKVILTSLKKKVAHTYFQLGDDDKTFFFCGTTSVKFKKGLYSLIFLL